MSQLRIYLSNPKFMTWHIVFDSCDKFHSNDISRGPEEYSKLLSIPGLEFFFKFYLFSLYVNKKNDFT